MPDAPAFDAQNNATQNNAPPNLLDTDIQGAEDLKKVDWLLDFERLPPTLAQDRGRIQKAQRRLRAALKAASPDAKDAVRAACQLKDTALRSHRAFLRRKAGAPYALLQNMDKTLPVNQAADRLIDAIRAHQVIVVAGETGSGKTTQLPKLALLAGRGLRGQIGHTQPRRIAARSVAARIAFELGEPLGKSVAFKVRFDEEGNKDSLIKIMTDGILLTELARDPYLSAYDTLIVDEAHERSLNVDFILGYLKKILKKRPDFRLIITSATLDTDRFARYFAKDGVDAPVFLVQGRSFPVQIAYRPLLDEGGDVGGSDDDRFDDIEDAMPKAIAQAAMECLDINRKKTRPLDILVFVATESEIHDTIDALKGVMPAYCEILPLYARQSVAEQQRVFSSAKGVRLIVATNVAETSLTVPNIGYVIDTGFARVSRYSHRSRVQRLPIEAISQAAANQRAGRCGRVAEGLCLRLYSQSDFASRPEFTEPEILRTNLAAVILQMAYLNLGDIERFDFLTAPDTRLIGDGKKLLYELGALRKAPAAKKRHADEELTFVGKQMAKIPIDPRLGRMLVAAKQSGCLDDALTVVAALSVQDIRERPEGKKAQADQKHALFAGERSDFVFFLNAYAALFGAHESNDFRPLSGNGRKNFAKKHFLNATRAREWKKTRDQLSRLMGAPEPAPLAQDDENARYATLHRALLSGLLSFVAQKTENKGEYLMAKNQKAQIFPASVLRKAAPPWAMAFEAVETSQVYLRTLAKIEPEWIQEAAGDLLKYHYFDPYWCKKSGKTRAFAQVSLFGLTLARDQKVDYESVDFAAARRIFIEQALVAGKLSADRAFDFLQHNQAKLTAARRAEDKLRRRDLVASDEQLYAFYDKALDDNVANRKALLAFVKKNPQKLYFGDADVFCERSEAWRKALDAFYQKQSKAPSPFAQAFAQSRQSQAVDTAQRLTANFPTKWRSGEVAFALRYTFDPSSPNDGAAITVPKDALSQLDPTALLWGVEAWRGQLVEALLRSLPKEIRRRVGPAPDAAARLLPALNPKKDQNLVEQIGALLAAEGIDAPSEAFDWDRVDDYLKIQIRVVDEQGRLLEASRDLPALQSAYSDAYSAAPSGQKSGRLLQEFANDFCFVRFEKAAGARVQRFFALSLSDDKNGVHVASFRDVEQALQAHKDGVLFLMEQKLAAKKRQLVSSIDKDFKLAFAPFGDVATLKQTAVDAALRAALAIDAPRSDGADANQTASQKIRADLLDRHVFADPENRRLLAALPLDKDEFARRFADVDKVFLAQGQRVLALLGQIYGDLRRVKATMATFDRAIFAQNLDDMDDQIEDLGFGDFVYATPVALWQEYPRYLAALKTRLERLAHNLNADTKAVATLDAHMERIQGRARDPSLAAYRWAIEEYRVHLFAQPMKTRYPISEKRLNALWEKQNA